MGIGASYWGGGGWGRRKNFESSLYRVTNRRGDSQVATLP